MRFFGDLLPYEDALGAILKNTLPVSRTEILPIDDALGRVLACDVIALHNTPPFNRAMVDGFAVLANDTALASSTSPVRFELSEVVYAGALPIKEVISGQCAQIATGAGVPSGADAVVMVEDTQRDGETLLVLKPVRTGGNIGPLGGDIAKGEVLLKTGAILGASLIGVLASQGLSSVEVYVKPIVAILPTGEEIVPLGAPLKDGQIYDINTHTLAAMVRLQGGEPYVLPIVGDRVEDIDNALSEAVKADLVLTSGGSSVGEKDLLLGIVEKRGQVFFRGVKIKPSKPTTFSMVDGKPILGIPGNPTSCLMASYLFLVPALRYMANLSDNATRTVTAKIVTGISADNERRQFLTVKVENGLAYPVFKTSSAITSMSEATGYVVVPEMVSLEQGAMVTVILL